MREFLIYLAGPIVGSTYEECTRWRTHVAELLPPHIVAASPMRGKQYLRPAGVITGPHEELPLSSQKGITCRDRMDVMRCDLILVNLVGARTVSIGTVMEIAWADAFRKPIVIAMDDPNVHWHSMIREVAGFIVPTLDEAVSVAVAVLSPTGE
ncbi:MAG: nucleoside 2-deoxyribosyltransferase [Candidatus Yanofskybacteria bacterium]|nr:nucleoside 2-deoxyribosyltransferase [Candidatus Yanofskybacteria bacterium]